MKQPRAHEECDAKASGVDMTTSGGVQHGAPPPVSVGLCTLGVVAWVAGMALPKEGGRAHLPPPPPCPRTALRKNHPLVPRSNSRTTFLYHGIGFFMVLVDAGQLFRCAGQHFMCVATGPPIRGPDQSVTGAHTP